MKDRIVALEKIAVVRLETVLLLAATIAPFVLARPQWLVGTIVNTILFLAAVKVERKNWWPMIILPSTAVAARGVIFGPFTWMLVYFMPVIWLGNLILMYIFTQARDWKGIGRASLFKTLILFVSANIYYKLGLAPKMFLQSMGIVQLMTAIVGGVIANLLITRIFIQIDSNRN